MSNVFFFEKICLLCLWSCYSWFLRIVFIGEFEVSLSDFIGGLVYFDRIDGIIYLFI